MSDVSKAVNFAQTQSELGAAALTQDPLVQLEHLRAARYALQLLIGELTLDAGLVAPSPTPGAGSYLAPGAISYMDGIDGHGGP